MMGQWASDCASARTRVKKNVIEEVEIRDGQ